MADTNKNFGLVGLGGDVQFGKNGGRLSYSGGVFAVKDASATSLVRLQVANATQTTDAVSKGQLDQAVTALQSEIDDVSLNTVVLGTAGRITVSGDAQQGWTVNLASNYVGQNSITTVGTITSGRWQGNAITSQYGGTGFSTYAGGDLLVGIGTSLARLPIGTPNQVLKVNSSGTGLEYGPAVDASLGSLLQATQVGAGLAANGVYVANGAAHYIGAATSLSNADVRLDNAIYALANTVSNLSSDQIVSTDQRVAVRAQATGVEISGNVNGVRTLLMDVRSSANTNTLLRFDLSQSGKAILKGSGATNTDVVLSPNGNGVVDHSGSRVANVAAATLDTDAVALGQANAIFMRYLTTTFTENNTSRPVGTASGIVMRIIVLITTPFANGAVVTVGHSGNQSALVGTNEIDLSTAGLYVIDRVVQVNQTISAYVSGGVGSGSGRVIVEYLKV